MLRARSPEGQTYIVGYEFKARLLSEPIICDKSVVYLVDTYMVRQISGGGVMKEGRGERRASRTHAWWGRLAGHVIKEGGCWEGYL